MTDLHVTNLVADHHSELIVRLAEVKYSTANKHLPPRQHECIDIGRLVCVELPRHPFQLAAIRLRILRSCRKVSLSISLSDADAHVSISSVCVLDFEFVSTQDQKLPAHNQKTAQHNKIKSPHT
jgi:hypothetical protein